MLIAQSYPGELKKLRPSILWNCLVMLSLCHNKPYKLESPLPKITGCLHLHQYDFLNNLLAETGTNTPQEAMTALQITASTCPTQYPKPMIFGPVRETGQGSSHIVTRPLSESCLSTAYKCWVFMMLPEEAWEESYQCRDRLYTHVKANERFVASSKYKEGLKNNCRK